MRVDKTYIFCVDTDTYAGNFERELCAYMTGMLGECEVGREAKKLYEDEGLEPLDDLVGGEADDHGTFRPVRIMPTPGWFNDGHGEHYRESDYDEAKVIEKRNQTIEDYAVNTTEKVYADKAHGKKEADRQRERKKAPLEKYPAYMSAGIFLTRKPTTEEIEFLKGRAQKFLTEKGKLSRFSGDFDFMGKFKIEGFRVVTRTTDYEGDKV